MSITRGTAKRAVDPQDGFLYTGDIMKGWRPIEAERPVMVRDIDSFTDTTGMQIGGMSMPRCRVTIGYDEYGKPKTKRIQAKTEAEMIDRILMASVESGRFQELLRMERKKKKTPFKEYARLWLEDMKRQGKGEQTLKTYRSALQAHILPAFGDCFIEEITWKDVQRWLDERKDRAKNSVRQYWVNLKCILDMAVDDGLIERNPAKSCHLVNPATKAHKRQALTKEQMQSIAKHVNDGELDALDQCLLAIYMTIGSRKGETLALRWEDIDFDNNVVHIRYQTAYDARGELRAPKYKSMGDVPLSEWAKSILMRHRKDTGFIFAIGKKEKPMCGNTYNKRFQTLKGKIDLYGATGHSFRHSAITAVYHDGVDAVTLKSFARHKNIATTLAVYVHPREEKVMHCGKIFDGFLLSDEMNKNTFVS